jgi:hypothetical protein
VSGGGGDGDEIGDGNSFSMSSEIANDVFEFLIDDDKFVVGADEFFSVR